MDVPNTAHHPRRRGQDGFAVAELVVVLVFSIGLLVVATMAVRGIRAETSTTNCRSDLRALKLATEEYHAENDAYPIDKSVLIESGLVKADEVSRWTVEFAANDAAPTYTALDSACR